MWKDVTLSVVYLMNYAQSGDPWLTPLRHTWSLAVEEQFYLLWPLAVLMAVRTTRGRAIRILIAVWIAITFGRIVVYAATLNWDLVYFPLHLNASGLVLGAIAALLPRGPSWLGWIGLFGILASFGFGGSGELTSDIVWRITAVEFATAALLIGLHDASSLGRVLSARPLVTLGLDFLWCLSLAPSHLRGGRERASTQCGGNAQLVHCCGDTVVHDDRTVGPNGSEPPPRSRYPSVYRSLVAAHACIRLCRSRLASPEVRCTPSGVLPLVGYRNAASISRAIR